MVIHLKTLSVSHTWHYVRILCERLILNNMAEDGRGLLEAGLSRRLVGLGKKLGTAEQSVS